MNLDKHELLKETLKVFLFQRKIEKFVSSLRHHMYIETLYSKIKQAGFDTAGFCFDGSSTISIIFRFRDYTKLGIADVSFSVPCEHTEKTITFCHAYMSYFTYVTKKLFSMRKKMCMTVKHYHECKEFLSKMVLLKKTHFLGCFEEYDSF